MESLIVFAHGAGAPSSHPWMRAWAQHLATCGTVVTFDYPYMQQGRKTPDRQPELVAAHAEAVKHAQQSQQGAPLVLAGKSMGSRMGCHLAAEMAAQGGNAVQALVCFGYPLRSASSGKSRADILAKVRAPILFVQGTRDPLCPLAELEPLLPHLPAGSALFVVQDGDHSLLVAKRTLAAQRETQDEVDQRILGRVRDFLTPVVQRASSSTAERA